MAAFLGIAMIILSVIVLAYVDEFEVRGREAKVKIWSISAATDEPTRVAVTAV